MNSIGQKIKTATPGEAHMFFMGQAGFVFVSGRGTILGVDLYLSECVERLEGHIGFKRLVPAPISASEIEFDGIIATHAHYDHFDYDAMHELTASGKTRLFVSENCDKLIDELSIRKEIVSYVKPGMEFAVKDISVRGISCDHGAAAPDAFGVLISMDGKRIYIAGDTCFHAEYKDEILRDGKIDVMIAPINGAYGNLNEADCVALAEILAPELVVPCHYGMFAAHGGDPWKFCELMNSTSEKANYTLLTVGEHIIL